MDADEDNVAENLVLKSEPGELHILSGDLQPRILRIVTPNGRLAVEFRSDGSVEIGDLPYPELVQAITEACEPLTNWRTGLIELQQAVIELANDLEGRMTPATGDEYGRRLRALVPHPIVTWYIAECRECGGMKVPFRDFGERQKWVSGHVTTGHSIDCYQEYR